MIKADFGDLLDVLLTDQVFWIACLGAVVLAAIFGPVFYFQNKAEKRKEAEQKTSDSDSEALESHDSESESKAE